MGTNHCHTSVRTYSRGDDDGTHESMGAPIVVHGNPSPVLQPAKHDFDAVSLAIERCVVRMLDLAVLSRWNAGRGATRGKRGTEPITVIATVCNELLAGRQMIRHQARAPMVTHLAFRQQHGNWRSLPSHTACSLEFSPPLVRPIRRGTAPF